MLPVFLAVLVTRKSLWFLYIIGFVQQQQQQIYFCNFTCGVIVLRVSCCGFKESVPISCLQSRDFSFVSPFLHLFSDPKGSGASWRPSYSMGFLHQISFSWGGWVRAHFEVIKWSPPGAREPNQKKSKKAWVLSEVVFLLF